MHIDGIWGDNEHTTLGSLLHNRTDEPGYETDGDVKLLRALPLYSLRYGLTGKADIVEMRGSVPLPVEYKKGRRRQFDNDDIQLCAQAFCLEEMFGVSVPEGAVYHASSKRRRKVFFEATLRRETAQTITAVRDLLASGRIPPAELKPRCSGCSLRPMCLPELTGIRLGRGLQDYQRSLWGE
jgi:CRISPR-associated exonuclease Cas4